MASFSIPLTGLTADSTALNTIANDLSNMNTTAFKTQTVNFSDLFYQQIGSTGSGDPIQVGAGTQVANTETNFTNGTSNSTGVNTDVALQGSGFFVVGNGGGGYELSRAGNFSIQSNGDLVTSNGLSVMGYPAVNGAVNTNAPLTAINIPVGQVQQPQATSSFGITANLDSASAIGTSFPAPITLYDSQGVAYQAQVTFTKTGTNTWSYNIAVPDQLTASNTTTPTPTTMAVTASTPAAANLTVPLTATSAGPAINPTGVTLTAATSTSAGDTIYTYNFGAGGEVDGATSLTIGTNAAVTPAPGDTSIGDFANQISALGNGISANVSGANNQILTVTVPTGTTVSGSVAADLNETTNTFTFNTGGTVDPASTLTISGTTTAGAAATMNAPTITSGESMTQYAADLTTAIQNAQIANVTVKANANNTLSIVGADLSTNGTLTEDLAGTSTAYNFGSTATVDPTTNFSITGQTATGASATIATPVFNAGETVTQYATALTQALSAQGIVGVSVNSNGGQLIISGANMSTTGSMIQDENATSSSYTFGANGGTMSTVDPSTNLAISGLTSTGAAATMVAPTITAGESVAAYATALQQAANAAGIAGVSVTDNGGILTVTGANVTSTGNVVQDAAASANASGSLTFNVDGQLVSPAANVANLTFGGLSDGAAPLGLTWDLLGTSGTPIISQVDTTSAVSSTTQNGYASGQYQSFTINSDGTVTASYSNGQMENVGQLALANVNNLQGLELLGDGDYATTLASGTASIATSGTNGLATMEDGALEGSNVNISTEFSDLIIAQRAFEANAKSVTTFDTVSQDTINMVH